MTCIQCNTYLTEANYAKRQTIQIEGYLNDARAELRAAIIKNNSLSSDNTTLSNKIDTLTGIINSHRQEIFDLKEEYNDLDQRYDNFAEKSWKNEKTLKNNIKELENTIVEMRVKATQQEAREMVLQQEVASTRLKALIKEYPKVAAKLRGISVKPRKSRTFAPVEEND